MVFHKTLIFSGEKRLLFSLAAVPNFCRNSSLFASFTTASAKPSRSPGGIKKTSTPSVIISDGPQSQSNETIGNSSNENTDLFCRAWGILYGGH
jgi:hypothetical protein